MDEVRFFPIVHKKMLDFANEILTQHIDLTCMYITI